MMTFSQRIKQQLFRFPVLTDALYRAKYWGRDGSLAVRFGEHEGSAAEVFGGYFDSNHWGDADSLSGTGSNAIATAMIRRSLPRLLRRLQVKTLLDAPCGDLFWMRKVVDGEAVQYIGGDIVAPLIERLAAEITDPRYGFKVLDVVADPLPAADLWLCRSCFIHLPNAMVRTALSNFYRSGIPYLLATQYDFTRVNVDIAPGDFRCVNLRRAPFDLPRPREELNDSSYLHPPMKLALWHRDDIPEALRT